MGYRSTGGSWESLGRRWGRDSEPQSGTMMADEHEPDRGRLLYGPKGQVLARIVDRDLKMGFKGGC